MLFMEHGDALNSTNVYKVHKRMRDGAWSQIQDVN